MNPHVRLVAILHIIFGALGLIGALIVLAVFGLAGGIVVSQGEGMAATIIGMVGMCIVGLIALLSVPGIIGGWALLARKSWARVLMIVLGALNLFHFPLGTALGIYTLWVMFQEEQRQQVTGTDVLLPMA
jgi:hypothetical protein